LQTNSPTPRLTLDRRHSFSGKRNLDWFFENRKWVRTAGNTLVEACWAVRPLPEGEAALRFLLLAAKRSHKRAHDRNKIKRWLRAAITEVAEFGEFESAMQSNGRQALVMLRISRPVSEVRWEKILLDVRAIALHVSKRLNLRESLIKSNLSS